MIFSFYVNTKTNFVHQTHAHTHNVHNNTNTQHTNHTTHHVTHKQTQFIKIEKKND